MDECGDERWSKSRREATAVSQVAILDLTNNHFASLEHRSRPHLFCLMHPSSYLPHHYMQKLQEMQGMYRAYQKVKAALI
jgi:hypothetical protein